MQMIMLKLVQVLLQKSGAYYFIKEHIQIEQKITRTCDDKSRYTNNQRLMLEVSRHGRHLSLADHADLLFA